MTRFVSLAIGLACLGVAGVAGFAALTPTEAPTPPIQQTVGLVFDKSVHDFGLVGQMEDLRADFRLTNQFSTPVTVLELLKGCACAEASLSQQRLEPGETATLSVVWRTGARRGKSSEVVTVLVLQDAAPTPLGIPVRLTAEIQPDVLCDHSEVRFARKEPGTATLRFTPGRMPGAQIRSAYPNEPALDCTADPAAGTVTIRFDATKLDGDIANAAVMVQTTSPKEPWITMPVVFTGSR